MLMEVSPKISWFYNALTVYRIVEKCCTIGLLLDTKQNYVLIKEKFGDFGTKRAPKISALPSSALWHLTKLA
jgi:hypothetical protein